MILITDDSPANIFSLKHLLEMHHFEVDTAESGEETLKKILKNDYSLLILDVQMPGMDGFEVADAIRGFNKSKDIPIIFLSAVNKEKKYITKGYNAGAIDYLTKPVDAEIFIMKVKTLHKLYNQKRELQDIQRNLRQEMVETRQSEQRFKKGMEDFRFILESLPQPAFSAMPTGEIEFVSQQWSLYSESQTDYPKFHQEDGNVAAQIRKAMQQLEFLTREVRLYNLVTREYRYHLLKMTPIHRKGEMMRWVGIFSDIHEQKMIASLLEKKVKERTAELEQKNKLLEEKNDELQQFVFVSSHDLKEPLRKILIFNDYLGRSLKDHPDKNIKEYLLKINRASTRMTGLIDDLLKYSKLSSEDFFETVNPNDLLKEILDDLEMLISEKKAIIKIDKLPTFTGIPGQIRQVFQNLLTNALKFTRDNVHPEIAITGKTFTGEDKSQYVEIRVQDNGIGFDEKYRDKIFTLFQRLHVQNQYAGTGIGLAIARKIMEKHKGSITAESSEGNGACFVLKLPKQHVA